jgi:hypothetical protein
MESDVRRQEQIIRHSLGLDQAVRPYRNHFAAARGSDDFAACEALVARGFMERGQGLSYGCYYHVTKEGAASVGHPLPK